MSPMLEVCWCVGSPTASHLDVEQVESSHCEFTKEGQEGRAPCLLALGCWSAGLIVCLTP